MKINVLTMVCILLGCIPCFAQEAKIDYPVIGQPCPDFSLNQVDYHEKKNVSLSDFKGKWLILDFWNKMCTNCIESFPKVNELQLKYKDSIQFLLIGDNGTKYNIGIRDFYNRIQAKQNLHLIAAYDSTLTRRFGVNGSPHIVIIDPEGITVAITYGDQLKDAKLMQLLAGAAPHFDRKYNQYERKPISKSADHLADLTISSSSLSLWDERSIEWPSEIKEPEKGQFKAYPMSLDQFYNLAYLGKTNWDIRDPFYPNYWRIPIKELKDSTLFNFDGRNNEGLYAYILQVSTEQSNLAGFQRAMQFDLKKFFGYSIQVETREMPCWNLVNLDKNRTAAIHKNFYSTITGDHSGYQLRNVSINRVLRLIWNYHQLAPPFIDETKINFPIDITLNAIMTDLADINRALEGNGLKLVKSTKLMTVVVIKE